ncbi:MAG TPA: TIR domain-containing protein [Chthoniobacteraceae bacterium]|jgi:hypothetical protein|nr:TIR domain-containing protein [Chthoniobacteraceae bacterium]
MLETFDYDVFLSYCRKDKAVVRTVAERLRKDGFKVWVDFWILQAGDHIMAKIDDGLANSRVLVLFMSANMFESDWAKMESGCVRFPDPLNRKQRFIPLRLDSAPILLTLAQYAYVDWTSEGREEEYAKLRAACAPETEDRRESRPEDHPNDGSKPRTELNPFQSAGALPHDHPTYIRRQADDEFERALLGQRRLIAITGEFGIGKSSLMLQAHCVLPGHHFFGGGLADMRSENERLFMRNFFRLFGAICDWCELENYVRQNPSVLFLDDLSEVMAPGLLALIPALISLVNRGDIELRIVTTAPKPLRTIFDDRQMENPKYSDPWQHITVGLMHEAHIHKLLQLLPPRAQKQVKTSAKDIEIISRLRPKRLQRLFQRLYDAECGDCADNDFAKIIKNDASYD